MPSRKYTDITQEDMKKIKKVGTIIGGGVLALILGFSTFTVVPANTVGIKYSALNGVNENTLREGVHFKLPFVERVYKIGTTVQNTELVKITGQTRDAQYLNFNANIKYRVNREKAFQVFKNYQNLDRVQSELIIPLTQRAIETVTTGYDVIDILGSKRNEVYGKIDEQIKSMLELQDLEFVAFTITDADAGDAVEETIRKEAVAKKEVEIAKQQLEKEKVDAETKLTRAKAEADANQILSEKLDDKILRKMEMEARLKHGWVTVQGSGQVITKQP